MESLSPGAKVEKYTVLGPLGAGGMASVYAVRHQVLGSRHALKILQSRDPEVARRLIREGQVQAQLEHPNLVPVQDVLDVDGNPALLMPLVEGPSLKELLAAGPLAPEQAGPLFRGVVRGVAYAHAHGVVHRDLKPANVMLEVRHHAVVPKVADFGLATALGPEDGSTRTGTFMGTPAYAAPEQLSDASGVDHRADLWSLGCILYALLAGEGPFRGTMLELVHDVSTGSYPSLADRRPSLDPAWVALVDKLLVVDREARLDSAESLLAELDRLLDPSWQGSLEGALLQTARSLAPQTSHEPSAERVADETLPPPTGDETLPPPAPTPHADEDRPPPGTPEPTRAPEPPAALTGTPRLAMGAAAIGALLLAGVGLAWDQTRVKVHRYATLGWEHGAPVGGTPATADTPTVFELHSRGGRAIRVDIRTSRGAPLPWPTEANALVDGWVVEGRHVLDYGINPCEPVNTDWHDGYLSMCGAFNATQVMQPSSVELGWQGGQVATRTWRTAEGAAVRTDTRTDEDGWQVWSFTGEAGAPIRGWRGAPRIAERWDEAGRVVEMRRRDLEGEDLLDQAGVLGLAWSWTDDGLLERETRLLASGEPDRSGQAGTRVLDWKDGLLARVSWLDGTDSPVHGPHGCASIAYGRDDAGRLVSQRCLDRAGTPTEDRDGCATRELDWREHAWSLRCLDAAGKLAPTGEGFAELRVVTDALGLHHEVRFLDAEGKPTHPLVHLDEPGGVGPRGNFAGPARLVLLRDPGPRISGTRWYDTDDRPMFSPEGWAGLDIARNPRGEVTAWSFLGLESEPVESVYRVHRATMDRTRTGKVSDARFFGTDGEPVNALLGYHHDKNSFDAQDRMVGWAELDTEGQPVFHELGFHRVEQGLDPFGQTISLRYFGLEDEPILNPRQGAHVVTYARDANGERIETSWLGLDDELVTGPEGCARLTRRSNPDRTREDHGCFDPDGNPAANTSWFGGARLEIDWVHGQQAGYRVYGVDDRLMRTTERSFDQRMHQTGMVTRNGDGLVMTRVGAEVDSRGRRLVTRALDADGALVEKADGTAMERNTYDRLGNKLTAAVFDADEQPVLRKTTGVHLTRWTYDDANREIEVAHFGTRGEPVLSPRMGYHRKLTTRTPAGTVQTLEYFPEPGGTLPDGRAPITHHAYDARGHATAAWTTDRENRPVDTRVDGASIGRREFRYDEAGRLSTFLSRLADGSPAPCEAGFSDVHIARDGHRITVRFELGEGTPAFLRSGQTWEWWDDGEGKVPVALPAVVMPYGLQLTELTGMAGWELLLDPMGQLTEVRFLGGDGTPAPVDGVSGARQTWSRTRRATRLEWFRPDGELVAHPDHGAAVLVWTWDAQGHLIRTDRLDRNEEPTDGSAGYAVHRILRDPRGNPIEESFWRADDSPGANVDGCHKLLRRFRGLRQLTEHCEPIPRG